MRDPIKTAIISGICTIIAGGIGIFAGTNINNSNNLTVNVNGEDVSVTPQKYEELAEENESLKQEIIDLNKQIDDLKKQIEVLTAGSGGEGDSGSENGTGTKKLALDLPAFHSSRTEFDRKQIKDRKGNEFTKAIILGHLKLVDDPENRYYNLEYQLDRQYSRLTGTVAFSEDNDGYSSGETLFLDIYADGQLVDTVGPVDEKTDPISLDVSIPSPEYIEFITYTSDNRDWNYGYDIKLIVDSLTFYN